VRCTVENCFARREIPMHGEKWLGRAKNRPGRDKMTLHSREIALCGAKFIAMGQNDFARRKMASYG
jgi:hypothetical protein